MAVCYSSIILFFFFKQKTAYELRISDWSSDVCSSDLFQRDHNLCLYCGRQFTPHLLTRDHVMPASRGGASIWENCVTACRSCNQRKDDRTPEEANMRLLAEIGRAHV